MMLTLVYHSCMVHIISHWYTNDGWRPQTMTQKKGGRFGKVFRALPAARGWCLYMFMCVYCLNWLGNIQHTKHTVSKTYKVIYSAKNPGFCLQDIDTRRLHRAMIGLHPRSQGIDLKGSSECRQLSIRRRHLQDDGSLLRSIVAHGGPTFQEGWPRTCRITKII